MSDEGAERIATGEDPMLVEMWVDLIFRGGARRWYRRKVRAEKMSLVARMFCFWRWSAHSG